MNRFELIKSAAEVENAIIAVGLKLLGLRHTWKSLI